MPIIITDILTTFLTVTGSLSIKDEKVNNKIKIDAVKMG